MNWHTVIWVLKSLLGLARNIPAESQHPVLVIEDNPHDAELIEMFCKKFGASCVKVDSLSKAREELFKRKFRLAFVDENMKDGSGVKFIDEITPRYPNLPISIITGDEEISRKLWSGRNWSIIFKGSHGGSLMGAIENALLTANGVNGHAQPTTVILTTWFMCIVSFFLGVFYRELPIIIETLKGSLK